MGGTRAMSAQASSAASGAWPALRGVLSTPGPVRRMLLAFGQSTLGDSAGYIALLIVAYQRLHSPWALTAVLLADFGPRIILGPLAAPLAEALTRRRCLVGADLLRAGALLGLALVGSFPATVALALAAGCGSAIYRPLASAALPTLAGRGQVKQVVSARATLGTGAETLGPLLAGGALALTSPAALLGFDAATFLIAAGVIGGLALERAPGAQQARPRGLRELTLQGVRAVRQVPGLSTLLMTATAVLLAAGMIGVAEPLLARTVLHAGNTGFALLVGAFGVGLVAGSYRSAAAGALAVLRRGYLAALLVASIGLLALALAPTLAVALLGCVAAGFGNALALAREEQLIQVTVPDAALERVFGVREALQGLALGAAYVAGGALAAAAGARWVYAAAAVGVLLAALGGALLLRRDTHAQQRP